jgi:hypothetical protein
MAETQDRFAGGGARRLDLVNAAALFALGGIAGIEDDAVAGFERRGKRERDRFAADARDRAEEDAALGAEATVGELLVVDAAKPARVLTAGERHLEFVVRRVERGSGGGFLCGGSVGSGGRGRAHFIEGLAIDARDAGDVFGGFEAALDFEGGDAGADEIGQDIEAGEVLRAKEVAAVTEINFLAVGDEIVREAASLGAFAAVGGAAAEGFAGEALARVGDAEGAVDKDLERQRRRGGLGLGCLDGLDLGDGIFAGEDDELRAEIAGEADAGGAGDRELRRGVDRKIGRERADESADPDVLDDGGIDTGGDDGAQVRFGVGQLGGEYERVERDVAADAAMVEKLHERGQIGLREIFRAHAGVETLEAEVDGIGAVFDGGAGAFPVAGGRE